MERKNYLNFDEPFLDKLVYRYMKLDKFFMLFEGGQNALSHPSNWGDPFENWAPSFSTPRSRALTASFGISDSGIAYTASAGL